MHVGVDGTGDAVRNFDVQLWDCVFCMARSVWDGTHADGERHAGVHAHITDVRLIALSLATQHEQLEQRTNVTCPQPFLLHPVFRLFLVCLVDGPQNEGYMVDGLTMRGIFV